MACMSGCESKTHSDYTMINLPSEQRIKKILSGEEDKDFTCYLTIKHKQEILELYNDLKEYYDIHTDRAGSECARLERGVAFKKIVEKWIDSQEVYVPHDVLRNVDACKPDEHTDIFKAWFNDVTLIIEREWIDYCREK